MTIGTSCHVRTHKDGDSISEEHSTTKSPCKREVCPQYRKFEGQRIARKSWLLKERPSLHPPQSEGCNTSSQPRQDCNYSRSNTHKTAEVRPQGRRSKIRRTAVKMVQLKKPSIACTQCATNCVRTMTTDLSCVCYIQRMGVQLAEVL
jgi:hypothetical protein